jgi:MOSC domain-containing protein YiiM
VSDFDAELRACVETILGVRAPGADEDDDAFAVLKQWLAERNLGLVPIAGADAFAWPGAWLARVRVGTSDRAVVMFGSPSGPMDDPHGALARGGTIEEGWVIARLDLRLSIEEPYGRNASTGSVAALLIAPAAEQPLVRVEAAHAVAGRGLVGDRYHDALGTFTGPGRGYELTVVEAEALDEVGLTWEQARRNVVTRGVSLNALVGRPFRIGPVECVGRRLAEPCAHLEKLTRPGIMRPLVHRAGLRADIVTGGPIAVGDPIRATDDA